MYDLFQALGPPIVFVVFFVFVWWVCKRVDKNVKRKR